MLTVLKKTMKFPTVLAATAMVAGFVPFGQAVCYDGYIALVNRDYVSTTFQSGNSFTTIS